MCMSNKGMTRLTTTTSIGAATTTTTTTTTTISTNNHQNEHESVAQKKIKNLFCVGWSNSHSHENNHNNNNSMPLSSVWTGPLSLKRQPKPHLEHVRHVENSLHLSIKEAKNLPLKKKYFGDILLDHCFHARTTSQSPDNSGNVFWDEDFNLINLNPIASVTIIIYAEVPQSRRRSQKKFANVEIGRMTIQVENLKDVSWHPLKSLVNHSISGKTIHASDSSVLPCHKHSMLMSLYNRKRGCKCAKLENDPISVRLEAYYECLHVLPLSSYHQMKELIVKEYHELVPFLDGILSHLADKTRISRCFINIHQNAHFLANIISIEIKNQDKKLMLRGNSIATKAIENYLSEIGSEYRWNILHPFIEELLNSRNSFEIDPQYLNKEHSSSGLINHHHNKDLIIAENKQNILEFVSRMWQRIYEQETKCPSEIRTVLSAIRLNLEKEQPDFYLTLIGSCIFLRYFIPPLYSPSLFGFCHITQLCPNSQRKFTLVAKIIQLLANDCMSHEEHLSFTNDFLIKEAPIMREYLKNISSIQQCQSLLTNNSSSSSSSSPQPSSPSSSSSSNYPTCIDMGYELASFHAIVKQYDLNSKILSFKLSNSSSYKILQQFQDEIQHINHQLNRTNKSPSIEDNRENDEPTIIHNNSCCLTTHFDPAISSSLENLLNISHGWKSERCYSSSTRPNMTSTTVKEPPTLRRESLKMTVDANRSVPMRRKQMCNDISCESADSLHHSPLRNNQLYNNVDQCIYNKKMDLQRSLMSIDSQSTNASVRSLYQAAIIESPCLTNAFIRNKAYLNQDSISTSSSTMERQMQEERDVMYLSHFGIADKRMPQLVKSGSRSKVPNSNRYGLTRSTFLST